MSARKSFFPWARFGLTMACNTAPYIVVFGELELYWPLCAPVPSTELLLTSITVALGALDQSRFRKLGMSLVATKKGSRPRPMSLTPIYTQNRSGVFVPDPAAL